MDQPGKTPETQAEWDALSSEERDTRLREEPEEKTEEEVKEEEVKEEEVQEELKEEDEKPQTEPRTFQYAGKYKSAADLEKAHLELQQLIGRQSQELGELRKLAEKPVEEPMPEYDPLDPESVQARDKYLLEQIKALKTPSLTKEDILEAIREYDSIKPEKDQIQTFVNDHPEMPAEQISLLANYADAKANMLGRAVTLEEALKEFSPSTNNTKEQVKAIEEAKKAPTTIKQAQSAAAAEVVSPETMTQAQWASLPEAERERLLMEVPMPE